MLFFRSAQDDILLFWPFSMKFILFWCKYANLDVCPRGQSPSKCSQFYTCLKLPIPQTWSKTVWNCPKATMNVINIKHNNFMSIFKISISITSPIYAPEPSVPPPIIYFNRGWVAWWVYKTCFQEEICLFIVDFKYLTTILALSFNSPTPSIQSIILSALWIRQHFGMATHILYILVDNFCMLLHPIL